MDYVIDIIVSVRIARRMISALEFRVKVK